MADHVCGLQGYNGMIDPPCPACEANRGAIGNSKPAPIVPRRDDLVGRLHMRAGFNPRKPHNVRLFGSVDDKLNCEAAAELERLSAEVARLQQELEVARRDGERLFDAGWKMAAAWACRDDLLADMDSNTFKADKLAAIDAAREG